MKAPWPGLEDPLTEVAYELVVGFNDKGEPVYKRGCQRDLSTLRAIQAVLEPLRRSPASITSVTMGKIELLLNSGARLTLRPVFDPSSSRYRDLLKIENDDVMMPDLLAALLNRWRDELVRR